MQSYPSLSSRNSTEIPCVGILSGKLSSLRFTRTQICLPSLYTGTAQSSVAGLALSAKRQLTYLNKDSEIDRLVISNHIEVLKVEPIGEVKKLRSFYGTVESHVRGLEGMEISFEMYGCFLTPIVMQKLPEEFRIAITQNLESETIGRNSEP